MKKRIAVAVSFVLVAVALVLFFQRTPASLPPDVVEIDAAHLERELGDASQMAKAISLTPHFTGEVMDGFTLTKIAPGSVADRLGLAEGDLIMSVGGIDLDSPEKAMKAHDELKELRQVDVKMARNGKVHWFVVRVKD